MNLIKALLPFMSIVIMSSSYIVTGEWLVTGSEKEVLHHIRQMVKNQTRSTSSARIVPLSLNYKRTLNIYLQEKQEDVEMKANDVPPQSPPFETDIIWEWPQTPDHSS